MWIMILKMTGIMLIYLAISMVLWRIYRDRKISAGAKILIGVIYGGLSVLATHFGVDYGRMVINIRDVGPLSAGLFFDPVSGIIAGLIGGIERYLAAEFWDIGSFTQLACSISTAAAGFVAAALSKFVFRKTRPKITSAFFIGAVMEVFHMYAVFITHTNDLSTAFEVVRSASAPMIIFSGLSLALLALLIKVAEGGKVQFFRNRPKNTVPLSEIFQRFLLVITLVVLLFNFGTVFILQTKSEEQDAKLTLSSAATAVSYNYRRLVEDDPLIFRRFDPDAFEAESAVEVFSNFQVGEIGTFDVFDTSGGWIIGNHGKKGLTIEERELLLQQPAYMEFVGDFFWEKSLCRKELLDDGNLLLVTLPLSRVYESRDAQAYETALSNILLFAVIYAGVYILVQQLVVRKLKKVNKTLGAITGGNLDLVVDVRSSYEFNYLSDNINSTVESLKGYITAAEKRMKQDLESARIIQESCLPKNFEMQRKDFSLYAAMKAAKVVGGDFYDFFPSGPDRIALVIADVSGKGIPASLFMMRSKTLIANRAKTGMPPSEILFETNNLLCEGNEAGMFLTVWIGIIDLKTGIMNCANAGHEYPVLMRTGGDYELVKDRHGFVLGGMENSKYREYELQLQPGDRLFVYTDGVPEAINEVKEQYGTDRLCTVLNTVKDASCEETLRAVEEDMEVFVRGEEQFDDITMLVFCYNGPQKDPSR